jgi:hypothetical protein
VISEIARRHRLILKEVSAIHLQVVILRVGRHLFVEQLERFASDILGMRWIGSHQVEVLRLHVLKSIVQVEKRLWLATLLNDSLEFLDKNCMLRAQSASLRATPFRWTSPAMAAGSFLAGGIGAPPTSVWMTLIRDESGIRLLGYSHRSSDRSVFEKPHGHLSWQTDTTV